MNQRQIQGLYSQARKQYNQIRNRKAYKDVLPKLEPYKKKANVDDLNKALDKLKDAKNKKLINDRKRNIGTIKREYNKSVQKLKGVTNLYSAKRATRLNKLRYRGKKYGFSISPARLGIPTGASLYREAFKIMAEMLAKTLAGKTTADVLEEVMDAAIKEAERKAEEAEKKLDELVSEADDLVDEGLLLLDRYKDIIYDYADYGTPFQVAKAERLMDELMDIFTMGREEKAYYGIRLKKGLTDAVAVLYRYFADSSDGIGPLQTYRVGDRFSGEHKPHLSTECWDAMMHALFDEFAEADEIWMEWLEV